MIKAKAKKPAKKTRSRKPKMVQCGQCEKLMPEDKNAFCFGCGHQICEECGDGPWGSHTPNDHRPPCDKCGERSAPNSKYCYDCDEYYKEG